MVLDASQRTEYSPKNPGDRGFGHGNTVTLDLKERVADAGSYGSDDEGTYIPAGSWVRLNGDGTFSIHDDFDSSVAENSAQFDGVVKHKRYLGEEGAVHLQGVVRVSDNAAEAEAVLDSFDNGDSLVHLG